MKKHSHEQRKPVIEENLVPPDGKYGWAIVISYAIANFVAISTTCSFGLIFKDKFAEMRMPAADLTLIVNTNSTMSMLLGLINGPLLRMFGYRKISIAAAILFSVGLMLTALTDSVFGFIITYGVITAIGIGLSNSSFALALNSYFRKKLNKATGIAMTLAGIGPIVYPLTINYLMDVYDVSGCMLIVGAIGLHMLIGAVLLQPVKWHLIKDSSRELLTKEALNFPAILPNVSTFLSIGKFSNSSFIANSGPRYPFASNDLAYDRKSSVMEIPDIDTQSIYGFDQIIHRQPSNTKLDQQTIARNFSKRTLCLNTIPQNVELGFGNNNTDANDSQVTKKPLRWFETGSTDSIHLGSSLDIYKETTVSVLPNRRKSSLMPFRRQSQQLIQNVLRKSSKSHHIIPTEELEKDIRKDAFVPEILNENEEYMHLPEIDENTSCCCSIFKWVVQFFDLDLLRDNIYLNIMIGMAITIFAESNFAILTPFILDDLNFSSDDIAKILFVMAIADLISRFCSPFIADRLNLSIRVAFIISLILLMATRTLMMFTTDRNTMLMICTALAVAKGIRSVYMSIVIPSYIPIERLASASAIQLTANGIVFMSLGLILGLIKDVYGSYVYCIILLNLCSIITITMYSIEIIYTRYKNKQCEQSLELGE